MEEDREEAREEEAKKKRQEYANDENDEKEEDNFDWDCDGSTPEERQYLESILPEEFKYKVNKLNIEETSDVVEETKFRTEFVLNVCSKKETDQFIQFIEEKSGNSFRPSRKERNNTKFRSNRYNCVRKIRDQRGKKSGEGEEKQRRRTGSGNFKQHHFQNQDLNWILSN